MIDQSKKIGVIIANLGTPDAPTTSAVYKYLAEFLSDKRVIDLPSILWKPLLYGVILPIRSPKVAKLYQEIWTENGSPLRHYTQSISDKLSAAYQAQGVENLTFVSGMSYGSPNLRDGLAQLEQQGIKDIVVLPLYPQYSATTTAVICDQISQVFSKTRHIPQLRTVMEYCDNQQYIDALSQSVRQQWQKTGQSDKLVMSFHGMPQRYVDAGDPYQAQCERTANALAKSLGLSAEQWLITYQSRFGKAQWLTPYTDLTLATLAQEGTKSVDIICPAFAVDCLETIEEIAQENSLVFEQAGGEIYHYIPALNDDTSHVDCLKGLLDVQLSGL